jgi:hypothetical protein
MAKKRKRKGASNASRSPAYPESDEWTDEEWKSWGERFGKHMGHWGERFSRRMAQRGAEVGEEMGDIGERFGGGWFYRPFNFIGPIISAVFGLIFLALGAWVLGLIGRALSSVFISAISNFLLTNLQWFFVASLFFGYIHHIARRYRLRWLLSPINMSAGILFAAWVILSILNSSSTLAASGWMSSMTAFFNANLWDIFVALLVLGYVFVFFRMFFFRMMWRSGWR